MTETGFDEVPPPEDRAWIIAELAELVHSCGVEPFVERPLVEPTPAFFPDVWRGDEASLERLARRMLAHVGLGDIAVVIDPASEPNDGHEIWFELYEDRGCCLGAAMKHLGDDPGGRMALVVGAVFRAAHGLASPELDAEGSYREVARPGIEAVAIEGARADLTSVYLGLGLLATNHGFKNERVEGRFKYVVPHRRQTHLPLRSMTYALAAQLAVRKDGFFARRRFAGHLESNAASHFHAACGVVEDGLGPLRAALQDRQNVNR